MNKDVDSLFEFIKKNNNTSLEETLLFLQNYEEIDIYRDDKGCDCLFVACLEGNKKVFDYLIDKYPLMISNRNNNGNSNNNNNNSSKDMNNNK